LKILMAAKRLSNLPPPDYQWYVIRAERHNVEERYKWGSSAG
jgi:hypothetical protein